MKMIKSLILFVLPFVSLLPSYGRNEPALNIFSTGGHIVYHLRPATVQHGGGRVIISAAYDGSVLCHTPEGKLQWKAETGGDFPFDLCVADINGDGLDESLVASGDGVLYAIGPDGRPLWSFKKTPPLFQVCAAKQPDGKCIILTGGEEQILYSLSPKGELRGELLLSNPISISSPDKVKPNAEFQKQLPQKSPIRHLRAGDFLGTGRDFVAMATTTLALNGNLGLSLVDPQDLSRVWSLSDLGKYVPNSGRRFFSMAVLDLDHNGKQDILLSGTWGDYGKIYAYDGAGKQLFVRSDPRIPVVPYRMNLLVPVKLPGEEYIIGQFGNILIVYNLDGSCREVVTGSYAYANASFDPVTQTLYCGSEVSGGDEVVAVHLDRPGWQKAFAEVKTVGKLAKIIANMETLKAQVARFKAPAYQPAPRHADVLLMDEYHCRTPQELRRQEYNGKNLHIVSHITLGQKSEPGELWCRDRSAFSKYDLTADEVVAQVEKWEASGLDFVLQASHTTAMHMSPSTFERVLKAAPKHLWGFEFSEPGEQLDDQEHEVVKKIFIPLAEQCRQNGRKKILLRTKNIFWNGNVYSSFWQGVLMDPRYRDIFIPCLEETNSRTQDLSLAGRLGLWQCGVFDHWASRAETDNACFDRMWEWSSQQVFSHHLRNLVSTASQGSDIFFNGIHQGPFSADLETQLFPFFDMLKKGIIFIPQRSELASLSGVALGMRSPPSPAFVKHGTNGHGETYPRDEHPPLVFDRLDCYWGGAPLEDHDFSHYAFGVQRRMTNFLPQTPFGMVTMVPDAPLPGLDARYTRKISTDGQFFYDEIGQPHGPAEYRPVVEAAMRESSAKLPVLVRGAAHWSAAWLDAKHLRVTLIDPGYLDPADRDVEIVLQQEGWTRCRDILENKDLPIHKRTIPLRIPMGTLRIVDLIQE
jgi:hypothetical protein